MKRIVFCFFVASILVPMGAVFAESRHHGLFEPGHRLDHLPSHHMRLEHKDHVYFFFGGNYFRRDGDHYRSVRPPRGLHVPYLPPGHHRFLRDDRHYYYLNHTYYLWDDARDAYYVVDPPPGSRGSMPASDAFNELYIYPASGQSPRQQDIDYGECHMTAVHESGHDPDRRGQNPYEGRDYRKALIECLDGRGYTVR